MSYSDESDDLTSNKSSVTWKTRTGVEADAWEEFLKSADRLMLPWPNRAVPDLADEILLIEDWGYENHFLRIKGLTPIEDYAQGTDHAEA